MPSSTRIRFRTLAPKLLEAQMASWFPVIPARSQHFNNLTSLHWMRAVEFIDSLRRREVECVARMDAKKDTRGERGATATEEVVASEASSPFTASASLPVLVLLANRCYFPKEGTQGWQASLHLFRLVASAFSGFNDTVHRCNGKERAGDDRGVACWPVLMRNVVASRLYGPNALAHLMRNMTLSKGRHWMQTLSLYTAALLDSNGADEVHVSNEEHGNSSRQSSWTAKKPTGSGGAPSASSPLSNAALARPMRKLTLTSLLDAQQWQHALIFFHHTLLHRDLPHFINSGYLIDLLGRHRRFHEIEVLLSLLVPLVGNDRVVVPRADGGPGASSERGRKVEHGEVRHRFDSRKAWTKCFCLALGHLSKSTAPNAAQTFSTWLDRVVEVIPRFEPDAFVRAAIHRTGSGSQVSALVSEPEEDVQRTDGDPAEDGRTFVSTHELSGRAVESTLATVRVVAMQRDWLRAFLLLADLRTRETTAASDRSASSVTLSTTAAVEQMAACRPWLLRALPNDAGMSVLELRRRLDASVAPPSADAKIFSQEKEATLLTLVRQQRTAPLGSSAAAGRAVETTQDAKPPSQLWVNALGVLMEDIPMHKNLFSSTSSRGATGDDLCVRNLPALDNKESDGVADTGELPCATNFLRLVKTVTPSAVATCMKIPMPWAVALRTFWQFRGLLVRNHAEQREQESLGSSLSQPARASQSAAPVSALVLTLCHLCETLIDQEQRDLALRVASYLLHRAGGSPSAKILAQLVPRELQNLLMEHGHLVHPTVLAYAVTRRTLKHRATEENNQHRTREGCDFTASADSVARWQDAVLLVQHCATRMVHQAASHSLGKSTPPDHSSVRSVRSDPLANDGPVGRGGSASSAALPVAAMVALLRRLGGHTVAVGAPEFHRAAVDVDDGQEAFLPPSQRWNFALRFMKWVVQREAQSIQRANRDFSREFRAAQIFSSLSFESALLALSGVSSSSSSSSSPLDSISCEVQSLRAAVAILNDVFIRHRLSPPVFCVSSSTLEQLLPDASFPSAKVERRSFGSESVADSANRHRASSAEALNLTHVDIVCRTECVAIACAVILRSVAAASETRVGAEKHDSSSPSHIGALATAIRFLSFAQRRRHDVLTRSGLEAAKRVLDLPHRATGGGEASVGGGNSRVEPIWCLSMRAMSLAAGRGCSASSTSSSSRFSSGRSGEGMGTASSPSSSPVLVREEVLSCDLSRLSPRVVGHFLMGLVAGLEGSVEEDKKRNTEVASRVLYWMERSHTSKNSRRGIYESNGEAPDAWTRDALREDVLASLLRSTNWQVLAPVLSRYRRAAFLAQLQKVEGAAVVDEYVEHSE